MTNRSENNQEPAQESNSSVPVPVLVSRAETRQPKEPKPEDFSLPESKEEWEGLVEKLVALGLTTKDSNAIIEKRKRLFNAALKEFNSAGRQAAKKGKAQIKNKQHQ